MEDQQPGPGDLTTGEPSPAPDRPRRGLFRRRRRSEPPTAGDAAAEVQEAPPAAEQTKTPVGKARRQPKAEQAADDAAEETAEAQDAGEDAAAETVLVEHRPAGRRLLAAAAIAAVLFVAAAAFAGAAVQPYLVQRALVATKLEIARTATEAITALWTYTPEDMNTLADRATVFLGGDFADEYRRYIDAIVEPNKQAQVTNSTQVMGAAVESVSPAGIPTEATAIVYTNSVATSPVTKNIPSLRYLSYRLTMQRDGGDWLITRMSTITTFDLTPQL
ncbi:mammalian cell entry protein [Mycolicibacterium duvalii]|uniref:Mammalian cell entry protein n=1 Tax=Mycolicibacterium duvalii TaxID=39688 RepID=A0A7I7K734_9MYCO|nr:mammalian cell entry protein [Mycolicibacterium duvalii]MCV7368823.1 mammalian cell entry protein [Mycolicibacterium duvalii]PEG44329.1 mammalian cell entry protein [Mycolicibacterium duvalii]BBX19281.1 mammalian cell entry protein [Mycolicibacterium duvalii]